MSEIGSAMSNAALQGTEHLRVAIRRRPGRWVATATVIVLAVYILFALATNQNFQWAIVGHYFLNGEVLAGLLLTLELTALAMLIGIVLGTILALMRRSGVALVSWIAAAYIYVFRGVPPLVQLVFWYNLATLYPSIRVGVPFGPVLFHVSTNSAISPLTAALLGLGLSQAAYTAEVVRAGLMSVPRGQTEAGLALGMSRQQIFWRIVQPQAMRIIVPPIGNETIGMLKASSLASVITLEELLQSVTIIYTRTFQTIPLLVVASLWYLIVTSVLTVAQHYVERRLGRHLTGSPGGATYSLMQGWWLRARREGSKQDG
jgi:polar amino acid transport system permease protein